MAYEKDVRHIWKGYSQYFRVSCKRYVEHIIESLWQSSGRKRMSVKPVYDGDFTCQVAFWRFRVLHVLAGCVLIRG